MSTFDKFARLAKKAIASAQDSSHRPPSGQSGSPAGSGSGDWRSMVQKAADAITGDQRNTQHQAGRPVEGAASGYRRPDSGAQRQHPRSTAGVSATGTQEDRRAVARYDYLMQTAEPQQIEQVHREAFARMTPEQRRLVEQRMTEELPPHERPASAGADDLARAAARTEASHPGRLRGLLARAGGSGRGAALGGAAAGAGVGFAAGGILTAVAGGAILSSVAGPLLEQAAGLGVDFDSLAQGVDFEGLTGGLGEQVGGLGDQVSGLGDQVGGLGEQVGGIGEQAGGLLGGFEIPGLDDFFRR